MDVILENEIYDEPSYSLARSASALNIDGLGQRTASILVKLFGIRTILDLFTWNYEKALSFHPAFTEESAHILCSNIRGTIGSVCDYNVADALNVRGWTADMYRKVFTAYPYEAVLRYPSAISGYSGWPAILNLEIYVQNNQDYIQKLFNTINPWRTYDDYNQPQRRRIPASTGA